MTALIIGGLIAYVVAIGCLLALLWGGWTPADDGGEDE